ncbi:hypothetical protein K435DRAFT_876784 [Dendrothele bispora CBS 962.96]|uniref:FAD/NAD(P)-binding domain-containing protein n=1 Tax=Dendrothele bispora (strain CBS 962.96) TaxID=1314807 RepID=A0A4S8KRJ5_DENBC|nr:hypothetical protein K435DRAFT_876784 [Dendrothele bispora CBS 962.96]
MGYAIQLSANSYDAGGGVTMFSCDLDPPEFDSNSDPDLDSHTQCVQLGHSVITRTISSIPTMATPTSVSTQTISGTNAHFFESSSSQRGPSYYTGSLFSQSLHSTPNFRSLRLIQRPGDHDTTAGSTMSHLTHGRVDESSKMHSAKVGSRYSIVIIGSQPAIYLAQANLDSILFEDLLGNRFTTGSRCTATVNVPQLNLPPLLLSSSRKLPWFPHQNPRPRIDGQIKRTIPPFWYSHRHRETISKIDLSHCPFRYWREGQEDEESETADTVIVATGAGANEVGLEGEEAYWRSGISTCAVYDGADPISRNKPLAIISGGDFAAEEATNTCTSCS